MGLQSILACISAVCSGGARWWAATSRRWEPPKLFTKLFAKILRPLGIMTFHQEDVPGPEYVEARSLNSINYIAANPPQYPKKPTEGKRVRIKADGGLMLENQHLFFIITTLRNQLATRNTSEMSALPGGDLPPDEYNVLKDEAQGMYFFFEFTFSQTLRRDLRRVSLTFILCLPP